MIVATPVPLSVATPALQSGQATKQPGRMSGRAPSDAIGGRWALAGVHKRRTGVDGSAR